MVGFRDFVLHPSLLVSSELNALVSAPPPSITRCIPPGTELQVSPISVFNYFILLLPAGLSY